MARKLPARPKLGRQTIAQVVILVIGLGLFLAGLAAVRHFTQRRIQEEDRYVLAFADIDCQPPPGATDPRPFLAEVQYLAEMPDRLQLLDSGLVSRLAAAFTRHPWVEKVEQVAVLPESRVRVEVVYRVPVLAVVVRNPSAAEPLGWVEVPGSSGGSAKKRAAARAVDARGVVLPASAPLAGLPVMSTPVADPRGSAGSPWPDPAVKSAARVAGFLLGHQDCLRLELIEVIGDSLILRTSGGSRILWGRAPGMERGGEAPAAVKLERLLLSCKERGALDQTRFPREYDVRPRENSLQRSIAPDGP